ncbi:hypothetical protein BTM36_03670 [Herbaspirillum sp. VT-16-41]|nr:hypothetical protein BTM36_03670 [Herbaspirillum sp. VT-16-41]
MLTQRTVLASVIGFLAAVLVPLAVPMLLPVASAHDTLISSSPATGESLEQAPKTLELTYSDEVLNLSPVVRLSNSAGEEIFTQTPAVSGNTASIDLPALPADSYRVQWRVVSSDGHPIEGTVDFTVSSPRDTDGAPGWRGLAPPTVRAPPGRAMARSRGNCARVVGVSGRRGVVGPGSRVEHRGPHGSP